MDRDALTGCLPDHGVKLCDSLLLDASNSMNHIQNNTATDMIREMAYSLPAGYDVGFVFVNIIF